MLHILHMCLLSEPDKHKSSWDWKLFYSFDYFLLLHTIFVIYHAQKTILSSWYQECDSGSCFLSLYDYSLIIIHSKTWAYFHAVKCRLLVLGIMLPVCPQGQGRTSLSLIINLEVCNRQSSAQGGTPPLTSFSPVPHPGFS